MNQWTELGVFEADNTRQWQTFETSQCWIRYLKIEFETTYTTMDTYFLTISKIKYLILIINRVLGTTVGQGMQLMLRKNNKTKVETPVHALWQPNKTPTILNLLDLKRELRVLAITSNNKNKELEEALNNATGTWSSSQEMSVFESLAKKITSNEELRSFAIELFIDLSKLVDTLKVGLLKFINSIALESETLKDDVEEIENEIRQEELEIQRLKERQKVLLHSNRIKGYLMNVLLGCKLILLTVCIGFYYYYKSVLNNTGNTNSQEAYIQERVIYNHY